MTYKRQYHQAFLLALLPLAVQGSGPMESLMNHRPANNVDINDSKRDRIVASSEEVVTKPTQRVHMASSSSNKRSNDPFGEGREIGPAFIAGSLDSKIHNILETTSAVERQSVVTFSRRAVR